MDEQPNDNEWRSTGWITRTAPSAIEDIKGLLEGVPGSIFVTKRVAPPGSSILLLAVDREVFERIKSLAIDQKWGVERTAVNVLLNGLKEVGR